MFYRKRETRNQACNRETSTESSSRNQLKNVTNIEDNLLLKKQVDEESEAFNHAHNTSKSNENEIEVDRINSMNIAKKSREQLKLRVAQAKRDRAMIERNLLKIRIKFLKHQQIEHCRVHNDDHYCHKKRKKINRMKKSGEQEITNYRTLNI